MTDTAHGVEAEVGFSAKLIAGLSTLAERVQRQTDETRRANQLAAQAAALAPISYRRRASGTPASGALVLDFGGPAQGRTWELRHVVVGGDTPADTRAGAAYVYRVAGGVLASMPAMLSMSDVIDWTATLPNVSFYAAGDVPIVAGERIFVVVAGGTDGEDYQAAVTVLDRLSTPTDRATIAV